mgnify:CR=1 FL=1
MKKLLSLTILVSIVCLCSCKNDKVNTTKPTTTQTAVQQKAPFVWEAANVYFLLPDRFNNGDKSNDVTLNRTHETGTARGFEGGDIKGITQKIKDGYFTNLGINVIWLAPVFEQIHGGTDESTGFTYGFHGYWTKDWTKIDPNFGTYEDLKELVTTAHQNNIRILLDAVINHTGPVTEKDPVWPKEWVRTEPQCVYKDYETTVACTLVRNLPDIITESDDVVELPIQLTEKWKKEGRLIKEKEELEAFFSATGYPKAPRFYIMKWLADYVAELGIDGYRVDTVKHVEESVWQEFRVICDNAYENFKKQNPDNTLQDNFYLIGEVYGYGISTGTSYNFSDKKVNYFDKSFNSLINFDFKWNAKEWKTYEQLFSFYSDKLQGEMNGYSILNYISSHDDGQPFDLNRERTFEGGTKLLLTPGISQIYYGDEIARTLKIEGAHGDANLRSFMNWNTVNNPKETKLLTHFQKLGKFRSEHAAIGAGVHKKISDSPYTFQRTFTKNSYTDKVVVALNVMKGKKEIEVASVFKNGAKVKDAYSNTIGEVSEGKIIINSPFDIVLLEEIN